MHHLEEKKRFLKDRREQELEVGKGEGKKGGEKGKEEGEGKGGEEIKKGKEREEMKEGEKEGQEGFGRSPSQVTALAL